MISYHIISHHTLHCLSFCTMLYTISYFDYAMYRIAWCYTSAGRRQPPRRQARGVAPGRPARSPARGAAPKATSVDGFFLRVFFSIGSQFLRISAGSPGFCTILGNRENTSGSVPVGGRRHLSSDSRNFGENVKRRRFFFCARRVSLDLQLVQARLARARGAVAATRLHAPSRLVASLQSRTFISSLISYHVKITTKVFGRILWK